MRTYNSWYKLNICMGMLHLELFTIQFFYLILPQRSLDRNTWWYSIMKPVNHIRMQMSGLEIRRFRRKMKRNNLARTLTYFIEHFILIGGLIVSSCLLMSCVQVKNQFLTTSEAQLLNVIEKRQNIFEGRFMMKPFKVQGSLPVGTQTGCKLQSFRKFRSKWSLE